MDASPSPEWGQGCGDCDRAGVSTCERTNDSEPCRRAGGRVFTVAGIVASITDKGIQAVTKKQSLGKLG